jgi:hypothetical protein
MKCNHCYPRNFGEATGEIRLPGRAKASFLREPGHGASAAAADRLRADYNDAQSRIGQLREQVGVRGKTAALRIYVISQQA